MRLSQYILTPIFLIISSISLAMEPPETKYFMVTDQCCGEDSDPHAVHGIAVEENGPAFTKDIVPGTVIKRADRQDVTNINDILNALEAVQNRGSKALLLLLSDGERVRFVAINMNK